MELINQNPYRIAGIISNSSERDLQKQKTRIKAFAKVGKEIITDFDFSPLSTINRTEEMVSDAFSNLEQNQDKVDYSLFWFINVSPFDNTAIEYLKKGDNTKAIEIWEKITTGKDVTSKNFSAFNNLGTLKLLSKKKTDIKSGINSKVKLIESSHIKTFVQEIADETYVANPKKQLQKFLDDSISEYKNKFTEAEIIRLFSGCGENVKSAVRENFTEGPLRTIEIQIELSKKKRKENSLEANETGNELFNSTANEIMSLELTLGKKDLKYSVIADQLASELLQCGIDYFNECQKINSKQKYLENAQKLTEKADSIAVGKLTKDRIKDSLETLNDMKDREVNQAIGLLKSIADAYLKAVNDIDIEVNKQLMMFNNIDYNKVDRLKANCLNWGKVVDLIHDEISVEDVEIIRKCNNPKKVKEYKELVEFLFQKIGPLQINKLKYICYWKDVKELQAKAAARKMGPAVKQLSDGCYIATMAYGDYDHPQVLELRKFRDNFLKKSFLGRGFIKVYYKYSPLLVKKLKDKEDINSLIRKALNSFINLIKN
ncbi:hypothetical protein OAQ24_00705 [Flavobacteriaceae bacterium]|nr:hypothetical protein [Flavobacteriaceae bacterium]